jgi:molecular chaperone DnaJ
VATDYYEILGVSRTATSEEIKKAYRRLAREFHPDANPGDTTAEAQFKSVSHAYEILSSPDQRASFDRYGADGPQAAGFGGVGDIFDAFFGNSSPFGSQGRRGPRQGADLEAVLDIDLDEAVFGADTEIELRAAAACHVCDGSGANAGSHAEKCRQCGGVGQVRRVRQSILGQMVTSADCDVCGGAGEVIADPCTTCRGQGTVQTDVSYQVKVPAGVDDGSTLRLTGRGAAGPRGAANGDLYVHIRVRPHERFVRRGDDLVHEMEITFAQATLGVTLELETLDETEEIEIAAGTQTDHVMRLRGLGAHRLQGRGRGDLLIRVVVVTPTDLTDEQDEILRTFAESRSEQVAPPSEGLLSRFKSAFQ